MTPRGRSTRKRGWPDNLYESKGYYSYRNPVTREWFGLGRNQSEAFNQAVEANLHLAGQLKKERLVDRIAGTTGKTVADWAVKYDEILAERTLSNNTLRQYKTWSKKMVAMLGADTKLRAVTALQVSEGLEAIVKSDRTSTAKVLRGFMRESFAAAAVKGWRDENSNPVRETKSTPVKVKRSRLTWEIFEKVRAASDSVWFRNAMELALISGQSRFEIAAARFKDIREGSWWIEREKTGAKIRLPVEIRLERLGKSLEDVIAQCRSTGVLSHYLVHQVERVGRNRPGSRLVSDTLTRKFTETVTDLRLDFGGKGAPTFHEIRSLSARLYGEQGNVNVQELLGHKSERTTLIYTDGRGEWINVKVGTV